MFFIWQHKLNKTNKALSLERHQILDAHTIYITALQISEAVLFNSQLETQNKNVQSCQASFRHRE